MLNIIAYDKHKRYCWETVNCLFHIVPMCCSKTKTIFVHTQQVSVTKSKNVSGSKTLPKKCCAMKFVIQLCEEFTLNKVNNYNCEKFVTDN